MDPYTSISALSSTVSMFATRQLQLLLVVFCAAYLQAPAFFSIAQLASLEVSLPLFH